jgi:2,3-bisphosphoglycerate-independent phosphoglycerate mutase
MQTYESDVLYERGDGEFMAVPDALSLETMDKDIVLCHRCLEAVDDVSEDGSPRKKKRAVKNMKASLGRRTL